MNCTADRAPRMFSIVSHHMNRCAGQISLGHQTVLVSDVQAFLGQCLDDSIVSE